MRSIAIIMAMSGAAQAADLNIYTYDSFVSEWGPGPALEKAFEAGCDCDLVFTPAGDGAAMLTRLRIEGDKTEADIALGLDQNLVPLANESGLFANHNQAPQMINGADITWDNPNFVAYDWGHYAFVYRKDQIDNPPASFDELADSDLKIVIQNPKASTPGLGLALWVYDQYGEDAEALWARLKDNVVTVTSGWSESYTLFLEGEADMALSYTTSPAYHLIAEGDDNYAAAKFDAGHGLQIELAGILKSSEATDLANDFLSFLQGDEAQKALMNANWMYPVSAVPLSDGFAAPDAYPAYNHNVDQAIIDAAIEAFEQGLR